MSKKHKTDDTEIIIEDEGESAADVIKKLRDKLKRCDAERQEYLEGWQRAKADYINLRKTEELHRSDLAKHLKASLVSDLLPLADTFEIAFANREVWETVSENWRRGVEYIYAELERILSDYGVTPLYPLGAKFNPHEHQSVGSEPVNDKAAEDTVVAVVKKGYKMGEVLLRPAHVRVGIYPKEQL